MGGEDANRAFNECVVVEFTGSLDRNAFEAAYHQLVQLHDVLQVACATNGRTVQLGSVGNGWLIKMDAVLLRKLDSGRESAATPDTDFDRN